MIPNNNNNNNNNNTLSPITHPTGRTKLLVGLFTDRETKKQTESRSFPSLCRGRKKKKTAAIIFISIFKTLFPPSLSLSLNLPLGFPPLRFQLRVSSFSFLSTLHTRSLSYCVCRGFLASFAYKQHIHTLSLSSCLIGVFHQLPTLLPPFSPSSIRIHSNFGIHLLPRRKRTNTGFFSLLGLLVYS